MKRIEDSKDADLANLPEALRQAAQNARDEAARNNSYVVVMRDGKIVREYPKLKRSRKRAA